MLYLLMCASRFVIDSHLRFIFKIWFSKYFFFTKLKFLIPRFNSLFHKIVQLKSCFLIWLFCSLFKTQHSLQLSFFILLYLIFVAFSELIAYFILTVCRDSQKKSIFKHSCRDKTKEKRCIKIQKIINKEKEKWINS